ncbi:MAG: prolyl oligopeptidase family serine peptidase [Gammaproteobacteria bacterium]
MNRRYHDGNTTGAVFWDSPGIPVIRIVTLVAAVCLASGCAKQDSESEHGSETAGTTPSVATEQEEASSHPVAVDVFHGVEVEDPDRWLEDWNSEEVKAWSEARNAEARAYLESLPHRDSIRTQLESLLGSATESYSTLVARGERLFALKNHPPKQQSFIVVMPGPLSPAEERIVVDPEIIDPAGGTTIDWYVPSPNGDRLAVSLSSGGSEQGDLHIFDVATGAQLGEIVTRVQGGTAGGDMAWLPDGSGFFYTRYPHDGERAEQDMAFFQQVYFHQIGQPESKDRHELGTDFPRIAEIRLQMDNNSGRLLATVQDGDSGRFAMHLRSVDGEWVQLSDFADDATLGYFGPDGDLFVLTRDGAPKGRIIQLAAGETDLGAAKEVVAEAEGAISTDAFYYFYTPNFVVTRSAIYVVYEEGGPSVIRAYDRSGKAGRKIPQLEVASVSGLTPLSDDSILFANRSYTQPRSWFRLDGDQGIVEMMPISSSIPVSFDDVRVVREFAASSDGTKIPVNILIPKGAATDGTGPALLTAYGGYGLSRAPRLSLSRRVLLDRGFIVAEANIRGGGEYGNQWHRDGSLTRKQNGFDDFVATLRHLTEKGYAAPDRVAIIGGSNGGLLMGATMTQHPDLARAVVSYVGVYDMLRSELTPNGVFNIPEYGTVKDAEQFQVLFSYSPYHNVKDATAFPATLFLTGANDPRVDPMHSRKMIARLKRSTTSDQPILLRTSGSTGHGIGTPLNEQIEELVDVYSFLLTHVGGDN